MVVEEIELTHCKCLLPEWLVNLKSIHISPAKSNQIQLGCDPVEIKPCYLIKSNPISLFTTNCYKVVQCKYVSLTLVAMQVSATYILLLILYTF